MYTMFFQNHVTYHTSNTPIIISWWSWWESHPCLKSYWTTISPSYLRVSIRLYLGASELPLRLLWKEEPCENPCTSTSRILGLRTSHESSSPLWKVQSSQFCYPDCNPHIPTSYLRVIEGDVTLECWSTNLYPTSDLLPPPTRMCGSSITLRKTLLIPNTIKASLRLGPKNWQFR